ncbi:MAG: hypothetical protein K5653_07335 [Clostridiales bacterium]|nr:hypothetical protein [Clostridiales bacterium]
MRLQNILSTGFVLLFAIDSLAQTSITYQYNGYRDGDKLYRIVADDTSLGDRGENCVWELPSAQKDDKFFKQTIILRNDSLTIVEGDLMLHYIATDKDLSMRGFQTREMYSVQNRLMPELKYPFAYGDSIAGTFSSKAVYYDTFPVEVEGYCYTVCDGRGVLTDGNQTLKDVLRVHHHNTVISEYDDEDGDEKEHVVSEVSEDKYLWYYAGCRYPVMDTRIITCKENGGTVSDTTYTSLYMPDLQLSELAYDDANSRLIAQREALEQSPDPDGNGNDREIPFPIKMSASLQPGNREIRLNYQVSEDISATFYACDLAGRVLGSSTHASLSQGEHHETLVLENRPINNIVMLAIIVGDRKEVIKVS